MKIKLKFIIIILILFPSLAISEEVSENNQDFIKKSSEKLSDFIKESFVEENLATNQTENKKSSETSLVDKIQGGLANILLGDEKPYSLMFDEKEISDVEKAVDSFKNGQLYSPESDKSGEEIDPNRKSYAFLASIMYIDKNYWSVWINNKKITSNENYVTNELYIESISKEKVSVVWTMSPTKWKILLGLNSEEEVAVNAANQVVTKFQLKPNQSYLLAAKTVIEGNPEHSFARKVAATNPAVIKQN